ncbi:glycosyltransferase [archaeon]|nr:glycosyltransferase [archaeon]
MKRGISAIMILYNDGEIVRKALESIKDIANEILIVHDGQCKNNTLEICKEYTEKIFIREHKGCCEFHQAFLYRKSQYEWILKIDADEYLPEDLQKNIKKLIKDKNIDGYSFLWPYWEKGVYLTKKWPRKMNLYRKSKISYLGFPNWGEPKVRGKIALSNFRLGHHHHSGDPTKWKTFINKDIKWITFLQAENYLKKFNEFDNFQYHENEFPKYVQIRNKYPLLTSPLFSIVALLGSLASINSKDIKVILKSAILNFVRYFYLGYYLYKLKNNKNFVPSKTSCSINH